MKVDGNFACYTNIHRDNNKASRLFFIILKADAKDAKDDQCLSEEAGMYKGR